MQLSNKLLPNKLFHSYLGINQLNSCWVFLTSLQGLSLPFGSKRGFIAEGANDKPIIISFHVANDCSLVHLEKDEKQD